MDMLVYRNISFYQFSRAPLSCSMYLSSMLCYAMLSGCVAVDLLPLLSTIKSYKNGQVRTGPWSNGRRWPGVMNGTVIHGGPTSRLRLGIYLLLTAQLLMEHA